MWKPKPKYRLKVKEVAQQKNISQRQLFFLSAVELKTIQKIYREPTSTNITVETLARLAAALEVEIADIIELVHEEEPPATEPEQPQPDSEA